MVISGLFFRNLIKHDSDSDYVFKVLKTYVDLKNISKYDNHSVQQYKFLLDQEGKISDKIIIFKTETLNDDILSKLNIKNCEIINEKINTKTNKNYLLFLNKKSIKLINKIYDIYIYIWTLNYLNIN
jgi:hypothetical protein